MTGTRAVVCILEVLSSLERNSIWDVIDKWLDNTPQCGELGTVLRVFREVDVVAISGPQQHENEGYWS